MSDTDYPSSSKSSHSSRRLDSSSLMSSGSSPTLHLSSGSISHNSSRSSSPEFLGYFLKPVPRPTLNSPVSPSQRPASPSPDSPRPTHLESVSPVPRTKSASPKATSPPLAISLPLVSPESRSPSPTWLMADLKFGRCLTPTSSPISLVNVDSLVDDLISSSSSSSSEDEAVEVKRQKLDPDYQPSTASTSPLTTADHSQNVSEEEEKEPDETDTETENESWKPSRSTSPELYSSPDDD